MQAESLLTDYDPYLEKEFWQRAFWSVAAVLEAHPQESLKADFYVRFDLNSLLENSDIQFPQPPANSFSMRDFLIEQRGGAKLLEMLNNREIQISQATLALASEIKEMLAGMKLFTTAYYKNHEEITRFVLRTARGTASVLSNLLYATGFCGLYQFVKFSDEAEPNESYLENQQHYERLKSLDQILLSNLSNLREYVVGCMSVFYLYSVGQTADGNWVGVRTTAVWT